MQIPRNLSSKKSHPKAWREGCQSVGTESYGQIEPQPKTSHDEQDGRANNQS